MMRLGIDAHKKKCVAACMMDGNTEPSEIFEFQTTMQGMETLYARVPERSVVVIEASTTGKVISRLLSQRYEVHMVAPPERKPSIKTDERDAVRIVREDSLGYLRRVYVPSQYIEEMRSLVMQQIQVGRKIARVKNQIHSLLERNMVHDLDDLSDPFGVEGLERIARLKLPADDTATLRTYLDEMKLHLLHHERFESRLAKMAESDDDVGLLMTIPGMNIFTAVTTKSRIGDIARFPTKKRLCSYAGLVPKVDNSGEYRSNHRGIKHGDAVLKYALTCAVRGAVTARKQTVVKRYYRKMLKRQGVAQKAEVAAARKLVCIIWKVLSSKQSYVEEDRYLTAKKMKSVRYKAKRSLPSSDEDRTSVSSLLKDISSHADIISRYPFDMEGLSGDEGDT
jgi:transposase